MISSLGVGSGLELENIVSQLMSIEQAPLIELIEERAGYSAQISALGQLQSAVTAFSDSMDGLADLDDFKLFKTAVTKDEDGNPYFTATTDSDAAIGVHDITVTAIAETHKLRTSAAEFTNLDSAVGTGTLNITVGTSQFSVTIDSDNNTVSGVVNAINNATDNTGVTATTITGDDGARIILTANGTGSDYAVTIDVVDDSDGNDNDNAGLSRLDSDNLTELVGANDATMTIDTQTVTSSSNTVSDALQGVTFTLLQTTAETETLTISRDIAGIKSKVSGFVTAFNSLVGAMKQLKAGELSDDRTTLTNLERQLRSILTRAADPDLSTSFRFLSELGVSTKADGSLTVNNSTFEEAVASDFSGLANFFADDDYGAAALMKEAVSSFTSSGGVIASRQDALRLQIAYNRTRSSSLQASLVSKEQALRAQFTALDTLVSSLNSSTALLENSLNNLQLLNRQISGGGGGG